MATIEQNLQRLVTAKANILQALQGKGVTVPSNATLSDVPLLISQIQVQGVYSITYALNHVTSTVNAYSATEGDAYTTTLSVDTGYENMQVIVEMGGMDITSTAYSAGVVTIASVTGDVVITASATAIPLEGEVVVPASRTWTRQNATYSVDGYSFNGKEIANDKNGDSENQSLPSTDITVMVFPLYKGDKTVTTKQMYAGVNASNAFLSSFDGFGKTDATASTAYVNDWVKGLYANVWNKAKIGTTETNTYNVPSGALYFITWWETADLANWGGVTITHQSVGEVEALPIQGRMQQSFQIENTNLFPYANANDSELKLNGGCMYYKKFPVVENTDFKVNVSTRKFSTSKRWADAWVDASGGFIASVTDIENVTDKILVPPAGATHLLLNALNPTDTVERVQHTSGSGGESGGGGGSQQTLLTLDNFLDNSVTATTPADMSALISQAQSEINTFDPTHKFLRVAVISDLHSVPSDETSQSIALYKNTSCNDNIALFGEVMTSLNCDAGFALGDYSDNRIAYSDKTTQVEGGVDKYKAEAKNVLNKLRNSHAKPMFFTCGNHEFGDGLKGQIYNADMCNRIIQTCNRPGNNMSVNYLNGNSFAYTVSFSDYDVKIAVDADGSGVSNGWDLANNIYKQTPANWTVGCMIHGSTTDAMNGRHDGTFTNHYTFSENNLKSFGVIRGHVHGSGQVGFDVLTQSENSHSLSCPRMSVPAGFYGNSNSTTNRYAVTVFIFDTDEDKVRAIRLGRPEWERYVEAQAPSFPYSYDFVTNDN